VQHRCTCAASWSSRLFAAGSYAQQVRMTDLAASAHRHEPVYGEAWLRAGRASGRGMRRS
jgi:hypothetical protein